MQSSGICDLISWCLLSLFIPSHIQQRPMFLSCCFVLISGHSPIFLTQCFCTCQKIISPQSCLDHPLIMENPFKIQLHLGSLHTMSPLYSSFSVIKDVCFVLWCVFHSTESTAGVKHTKKNNLSSALVRLNSLVYIVFRDFMNGNSFRGLA